MCHDPIIKNILNKKINITFGWGSRIRTYEMLESESNALPLGDTPLILKKVRLKPYLFIIYHKSKKINKKEQKKINFLIKIKFKLIKN